jgi:penicillin-binding protein 2
MSTIERVRPPDPRVPVSPQLAVRVAVLGALALIMFGIIFFRLWYLQVLSGEQYVQQANANRVRNLPIAAPRGEILDRSGTPIVTSHVTNAVQIVPSSLPAAVMSEIARYQKALLTSEQATIAAGARLKALQLKLTSSGAHVTAAQRHELSRLRFRSDHVAPVPVAPLPASAISTRRLFERLSPLVGLSARTIEQRVIQGVAVMPYANVVIKTDAGEGTLTVLAERQNDYPGVIQQPVTIRDYPHRETSAQVLGYVGQISPTELAKRAFHGVLQGTVVGQEGLEFYYDRYLRGSAGVQHVEVNSKGEPEPESLAPAPTPPSPGHNLKLTLDLGLQQEGEKALKQGLELANANGNPANAGAFLAMDPRNGQMLAMGSYPSFDPNKFAGHLSNAEYDALAGTSTSGTGPARLTNRAVNGGYPTGSTFKPITAMGALEGGILDPSAALGDGPCISVSSQQFCNAGHANYGALDLVNALRVSSDTYFFKVGEMANSHGQAIQEEARKLGIGRPTHIDLPSEITGIVPDRKWRAEVAEAERKCERIKHKVTCGISDGRPWSVGDNMHLAVGQGDLITSPLQLAVAYSTLANAYTHQGYGTVVRPHLGMEIDDPQGGLLQRLSFPPVSHVHLNYADLSLVMEGIHDAASQPGGTSQDVWVGWDQAQHPVYGKTGTAQHAPYTSQEDQAWYMCYIADPQRPIVIAVTIEHGGFGDQSAAPVARLMASQWFHKSKKLVHGSNVSL